MLSKSSWNKRWWNHRSWASSNELMKIMSAIVYIFWQIIRLILSKLHSDKQKLIICNRPFIFETCSRSMDFCNFLTLNRHMQAYFGRFFKRFFTIFPTSEIYMSFLGNLKQDLDFLTESSSFFRSFSDIWHFLGHIKDQMNLILIIFFNPLCGS